MPDVFDQVVEKVNEAIVQTAGMPFPERLVDISVELAGPTIWYYADLVYDAYGNLLSDDGTPASPPPFTPSVPTPPDPADGGAPPGGGLTPPPGDDDDDDDDD